MNIYKYSKDHGFEVTGEFRTVGKGEYYLRPGAQEDVDGTIVCWDKHYQSSCKYLILKKLSGHEEMKTNIHEYLKELGFEMTGEYREARYGDYYLDPTREGPSMWGCIPVSIRKHLILKKLRQTYEFDGKTFEAPEGYVFERVGLVGLQDVGKYIRFTPASPPNPVEVTKDALKPDKYIYVIFRKEN